MDNANECVKELGSHYEKKMTECVPNRYEKEIRECIRQTIGMQQSYMVDNDGYLKRLIHPPSFIDTEKVKIQGTLHKFVISREGDVIQKINVLGNIKHVDFCYGSTTLSRSIPNDYCEKHNDNNTVRTYKQNSSVSVIIPEPGFPNIAISWSALYLLIETNEPNEELTIEVERGYLETEPSRRLVMQGNYIMKLNNRILGFCGHMLGFMDDTDYGVYKEGDNTYWFTH